MIAAARLILAAAALAFAIWLIPASVHIAAWPASGIVRIAYMAPLDRLWLLLAAAIAAAGTLVIAYHRRGKPASDLARNLSPLLLLWLWLVPFLPWAADRAPLLLVFAGPLRWALAGAAVLGIVAPRIDGRRVADRLTFGVRAVFVVSLASYVAFGLSRGHGAGFGGDEPHYLIITQSLLADRDLDIANNHAQRDYRSYFPGELRPDFLQRGVGGQVYSIHAPGLPALLLPAFAVGGAIGAVLFMTLLASLTATVIFDTAAVLTTRGVATTAWIATCFSIPFLPHAWLIYPETAGALVVAWAVSWLFRPPPAPLGALLHGAALATLPWLHTKFALLVACFAAIEALRLWPRMRQLALFLVPIAASGLGWLYSFRVMYGVFDPEAPYGSYTRMFVLSRNIPRGVLGLLVDQKFGLLVFSPVYALAAAGLYVTVRSRTQRWQALALAVTATAFFISTTRLYMWWGGSSAPARFMVPMVPLLAPFVAAAIAQSRGVFSRSMIGLTISITLAAAAVTLFSPGDRLLYSSPHGVGALVTWLQNGAPFDMALPTFTEENWRAPIRLLLPWLVAGAIAVGLGILLVRTGRVRSAFWNATLTLVAFIVAGSALAATRGVDRGAVVAREQLALMRDYDPTRTHAVDVTHAARLRPDEVLSAATLTFRRPAGGESGDSHVLAGPFELPEGRYEARLWFDAPRANGAEAFVALTDAVVLSRASAEANPAVVRFALPIRTPAFVGVSDPAAASAVRRIDIRPLALEPRSQRAPLASHVVEPIGGSPASFMAYADDHTYPEGGVFWTRGTEEGAVVIATAGAPAIRLILHVGPQGGPVTVEAAGRRLKVDLGPDETRAIDVAVPEGAERLRIAVRALKSFHPSEVDSRSGDTRRLGCQVRPLLAGS